MPASARGARYAFGPFDMDVESGRMRKHGHRMRLDGKAFQLLLALLERRGEIVSRAELKRRLWHDDVFVEFDKNLNNAVGRVRELLGDSAATPRYIETIPRRGYRFIGELSSETPAEPAPLPITTLQVDAPPATPATITPSVPRASMQFWIIAALSGVAVIVVVTAIAWTTWGHGGRASRVRSIAVLPFANISSDETQDYVSDGITEALIMELSRIEGLRIISRTSTSRYRVPDRRASDIARELGVDAVVEGSMQREGERVRVTVQLIEGSTDSHLWADAYDRLIESVLDLQREVAAAIAQEIHVSLRPELRARMTATRQASPHAVQLYMRGRHLLNRRTHAELVRALEYFEQALAIAPEYAPAHLGVALAWEAQASWASYVSPRVGFPRAKEAARKALALDDGLVEAYSVLAFVSEVFDRDLEEAGRLYRRALALSPSDAVALRRYALHLRHRNRFDAALEMSRRAQTSDPLALDTNVLLGQHLEAAGHIDEAIAQLRRTVDIDPGYFDTYVHLAQTYERKGMYAEAVAAAQKGIELNHGGAHAVEMLVSAHIASGNHGEARRVLTELEQRTTRRDAYQIAFMRLRLGDRDQALSWLERACEERAPQIAFLSNRTALRAFDSVRDHPRFKAVVECSKLSSNEFQ